MKQRYGIHLATRLQADDPGKQANWADIDDDDDDWAPESIEWTDGTKVTLPHVDDAPHPPPEPVAEPTPVVKEIKKAEPAPKPSKSPTPIAAPAPRLGSGKAGLILKGAPEKPTFVAKPPGPPTPVKSPWAQLPPVEKVAPVAIDGAQHPPQQYQQNRFNQRDPHGFSGMLPPPAKEIAADDFSRTWRDGNTHVSRELYNSQSGRYEPVNEARRGFSRSDGGSRGPAVLQRPSHQDGPAEPSAAFQTHHTSAQQNTYGRRRTSSNVSGGSGNFARRMSRGHDMPPPHEMLSARRGSLAAVSDAPSSPRNVSTCDQHFPPQQHQRSYQNQNQPWQSRGSPVVSHPSPRSTYGQMAPASGDLYMHGQGPPQDTPMGSAPEKDVLEEQKNIMRRTRELAIKRRQEAEAKEETERKERIRIKLEAMGPLPERKKVGEEPVREDSVPTSIQIRNVNPKHSTNVAESSSDRHAPIPDIANENLNAKHIEGNATNSDLRPNGIFQTNSSAPTQPMMPDSRNSQSWQRNSASNYSTDRFTSWSAAPPPPQNSSRIWGPPTNEKTIGNGTFNPELNRLPEMSRQSLSDMPHPSNNPGPIGPPGANRGNGPYQANRGRDQYNSRPPPIGPPSANRVPQPSRSFEEEQRRAIARNVWGGVSDRISQEDVILHKQQDDETERKRELEAAGVVEEVSRPIFEDKWKQVSLNDDGTRNQAKKVSTAFVDGGLSTSALSENMSRGNARPELSRPQYNNNAWPSGPESKSSTTHRESKFFPNNHRDIRFGEINGHAFERSSSPSPPPPTMDGHPAYDSDFARPHVALPPPLPVVRLPPLTIVAPIAPPRPQSFAAAAAAPAVPAISQIPGLAARHGLVRAGSSSYDIRRGPTPSTQTGEWKEKIDQLFGKKSPPKTHALAVDSFSRRAFDHSTESHGSATVSLPGSVNENIIEEEEEPLDTKPAAEECFEEQEMGSLPVIKIPGNVPENAFHPAAPPRHIPRKFLVSDSTSIDPIQFPVEKSNNASLLVIMLPGQEKSKTVHLPTPRTQSNSRRGRGGSRQTSSSQPRSGRGVRDVNNGPTSASVSASRDTQSPNPSNNSSRGRGGRGFGNNSNWNRHTATPVHT